MESTLRIVVAVVLILVAAAIIIGMVSVWYGNADTTTQGFFDWFRNLFAGQSQTSEGGDKKSEPSTNPSIPFGVPAPG